MDGNVTKNISVNSWIWYLPHPINNNNDNDDDDKEKRE